MSCFCHIFLLRQKKMWMVGGWGGLSKNLVKLWAQQFEFIALIPIFHIQKNLIFADFLVFNRTDDEKLSIFILFMEMNILSEFNCLPEELFSLYW